MKKLQITPAKAAKLLILLSKVEKITTLSPNLAALAGWEYADKLELKSILNDLEP